MKNELLRSVSRSFYLSIQALPRPLRDPVGLAYLLARTSDTIADTEAIESATRVEMLDGFAEAVAGKSDGREVAEKLRAHFVPRQQNEPEKELISGGAEMFQNLEQTVADDRAEIRRLLAIIIQGQRIDLTRWPSGPLTALSTAEDLREYTYLVAGCVGEFWTNLCLRKVPGFTVRDPEEMKTLGRKYGCGLQLINILRDAGSDLRAGRCYFPEEELRAEKITAAQLLDAPEKFLPIHRRWMDEARGGLDAGLEYCIAINAPRIRIASVLPALIGARTLDLLQENGLRALRERIKVPRAEVRKITASATITLANRSRLRSARARLEQR